MSNKEKYPYFARTIESTALYNPAIVRLLRFYNWSKVSIITQNMDYITPVSEFVFMNKKNKNKKFIFDPNTKSQLYNAN